MSYLNEPEKKNHMDTLYAAHVYGDKHRSKEEIAALKEKYGNDHEMQIAAEMQFEIYNAGDDVDTPEPPDDKLIHQRAAMSYEACQDEWDDNNLILLNVGKGVHRHFKVLRGAGDDNMDKAFVRGAWETLDSIDKPVNQKKFENKCVKYYWGIYQQIPTKNQDGQYGVPPRMYHLYTHSLHCIYSITSTNLCTIRIFTQHCTIIAIHHGLLLFNYI